MAVRATRTRQRPHRIATRDAIPEPPAGWARLAWLGPGVLWMVSAAGSGEILFTPRVGALYGYALVWALFAAVTLKWFINREIGRFTVCTGASLLDGMARLPGPRLWAPYLILVPQLFVAVATIAGLAGSAATALILVFPGDVRIWTVASVLASTALVLGGKYAGVERVAVLLAAGLGIAAVAAAVSVGPDFGAIAGGANPASTGSVEFGEILPWLGFMLSGAAGMIWYSYWLRAKGYGAAAAGTVEPSRLSPSDRGRLRGWLVQMTLDNTVAVAGTLVITMAFLVLGAELLQPEGLVPEEQEIAEVLGELLGGVWGRAGFWFMVAAVFIGFWDTVLSDQDGFGRMFANGSRRVLERFGLQFGETVLMRAFVIVLLTALPVALYLVVGEPVTLLKAAGVIEAAHIPVVAGIVLYMNRSRLPDGLRPSLPVTVATAAAGAFFAIFALLYVWIEFA